MTPKIKLYGAFSKAEKQPDGTIIVKGIASSEAIDGDGETIKAAAMKAAIPDYMKFGAIREMHKPIAAGVALKCDVGPDGKTTIEAKIVDPSTVKKVEENVLKGFSIGGRVTERDSADGSVITGIKLTEISLVDRPCNPEALVSLCKVDSDDDKDEDKKEEESEKDAEKDEESEDKEEDKDDDEKEKFAKLSIEHDGALEKILKLESALEKAQNEIKELKAQPAAPKGVLKAIGKGDDIASAEVDGDLMQKAVQIDAIKDPLQRAAALIKLTHEDAFAR
jgi:hypothetical protein